MATRRYTIPNRDTHDAVVAQLTESFAGFRELAETDTFDVLDTFDWRLYKKGRLLFRRNVRYDTIDMHSGERVETVEVSAGKQLKFHWEFPDCDFTAALEDVLEMRALMPVAKVRGQYVHRDLLNSDEKTVARLVFETFSLDGEAEPVSQCRLIPVRGYTKAARRLTASMAQIGLKPARQSPVLTLLERHGFSPGTYSSKVNIALTPEMAAAEAVRSIMARLVSIMRANLPGVHDDIDSEFLHDFRVSVRRARSLLGQTKGILDAETTATLQRQLKAMGAITGNVRDLDVYLLKKEEYIDLVGDALKPGIILLFQTLQRKRRYAKNRMLKAMAGAYFQSAMADLDDFIQSDPLAGSEAPGGQQPIGEVAKAVIYKRYRRVVKKGNRISNVTPDEMLHALRIDCKKLRYLLEFFTSLFPEDQMKMLIKQLKQLQENLGDFNDLSVQQAFLIDHLETIKPQSPRAIMLAAAIGGLITRLGIEHRRVRSEFLSVFDRFNAANNRKLFKRLFA